LHRRRKSPLSPENSITFSALVLAVAAHFSRAGTSSRFTVSFVPSPPLIRISMAYPAPPICSRRIRTTFDDGSASIVSLRSSGNCCSFSRHSP